MFGKKEQMPSIQGEMKKLNRLEELEKEIEDLKKSIGDIESWHAHMSYPGDSFREPAKPGTSEKLKELDKRLGEAIKEKISLKQE